MKISPTFLGCVASVSGASISVRLAKAVASGLAIIDGSTYRVGQVGSFVRIPLGYQDLYGVVSEVGAEAAPQNLSADAIESGRWMKVQLVGEAIGSSFERGISQHPNVEDAVHMVTETDLFRIYGADQAGQVAVGRLSSAENIEVRVDLDRLLSRHSAVLGSTGSGKSTTVASLLRAVCAPENGGVAFPSARALLLDVHGEYATALGDIAHVFRIGSDSADRELCIPYWALDPAEVLNFLTGVAEEKAIHFYDKILDLKERTLSNYPQPHSGATAGSLTLSTPIPYSLPQLWLEMMDVEVKTFKDSDRTQPALVEEGDPATLRAPRYQPHAMGAKGPFMNNSAPGVRRQLNNLRSRLLDHQYDFLLHPGPWAPSVDGATERTLAELLSDWLGHERPITILDLSGVPSPVLVQLVGAVLRVVYEAMFWSREKSEGARERPLLLVMEEAHRYLDGGHRNTAREIVQRVVKEGRKYGVGAMIVSQRPAEVDETILSQCGTFIALRLSNPTDRSKVKGSLPDSLAGLMDMLPVLRTGEALITGEAARLPLRCRILLPSANRRPDSLDPAVADRWLLPRRNEDYERVAASWRAQSPRTVLQPLKINRLPLSEDQSTDLAIMERQPATSSNITSIGYDEPNQTLEVEFRTGTIYQYYNVELPVFEALMTAPSQGQFFNGNIRNAYPYSRVG